MADEANNSRGWIGAGAAKFLAAVDELDLLLFDQHDAVGFLRDGVDLQDFRIFRSHRIDKTPKLLAVLVSFMARRYSCQLLLGICQLTFSMFTFTF